MLMGTCLMSRKLMARLCPKGASFDSVGGEPEYTPPEIRANLAGCEHRYYIAYCAKWAEDEGHQKEIRGLLSSILMATILREKPHHKCGPSITSGLAAELVYDQWFDGYKCNHCGGRGIVGTRSGTQDCGNCRGEGGGCYSDAFRARWMHVSDDGYKKYWKRIIEEQEDALSTWENEADKYMKNKMRESA